MLYTWLNNIAEGFAKCCGWYKEGKPRRIPKWQEMVQDSDEEFVEHLRSMRRQAQSRCYSCC